jgi:hypothetical protein
MDTTSNNTDNDSKSRDESISEPKSRKDKVKKCL